MLVLSLADADVTDRILTVSLTPATAAEVEKAALAAGVTPAEYAAKVVTDAFGGTKRNALVRLKGHKAVVEHIGQVLGEVAEGAKAQLRAEEVRTLQAELVFAYWQAKLQHETARLDDKRLNRLRTRLRENDGNVHELLFVVDGTRKDDHLMGRREGGRKYDGIETIFRDRGQVERLAELGSYKPGKPHPTALKYLGDANGGSHPIP